MPEKPSNFEEQRSGSFQEDLHGNNRAGVNYGLEGQHPEKSGMAQTAYDVKEAHRRLQGLSDDELKRIPILPTGTRLEQGAVYINLREEQPTEFKATGGMESADDGWYVPKTDVDYPLWNRLIGIDNPDRLDEQAR